MFSEIPERKIVTFNSDASWTPQEKKASIWLCGTILVLVGLPSLAVAVVSTTFNAMFAYSLGSSSQEQGAWLLASLGFSLFVIGIPIARPLIREQRPDLDRKALYLWLACLLFSITSALGFSASTRDHSAASATVAIKNHTAHESEIARVEARLDKLPPQRPYGAVEAELDAAIKENATTQFKTQGCMVIETRSAQKACARVLSLQTELATIKDAAKLEEKLSELRSQLDTGAMSTSADPQAETLSWLTGGSIDQNIVRRLLSVFVALLVEAGSAIGLSVAAEAFVSILKDRLPQEQDEQPHLRVFDGGQLIPFDDRDGFDEWTSRCVSFQHDSSVKSQDAYKHYEHWCHRNDFDPLPAKTFGQRLSKFVSDKGGSTRHSNGTVYDGISLTMMNARDLIQHIR